MRCNIFWPSTAPAAKRTTGGRCGGRAWKTWFVGLSLFAICACSRQEATPVVAVEAVQLPGQDKVLATVNGSEITVSDLDLAMHASFGPKAMAALDEKGKKAMLDSLVAARAIAQEQEKKLSAEDRASLGQKVAAFREQLLVKRYLAENTQPEPVSQAMVEKYYKSHLAQFGAKTIKTYELISATGPLDQERRDKLLAALQGADGQKDWPAWNRKLQGRGHGVRYAGGSVDAAVLDGPLRELLSSLSPADKARLRLIDDGVYLARIGEEKKIAARPLAQVSAEIRKTLLPLQLKKAVKQASTQVLAEANVTYTTE